MRLRNFLLSLTVSSWCCYAGPTPPILDLSLVNSPDTDLLINEGIKLARSQGVEKRISADFSLERSWNNEVLFGGAWNDTDPNGGGGSHGSLSVTCLECYTRGTVTAKVTNKHFLKPVLRLGFAGVEAYAFLGVEAAAGETFSLTLFASDSPLGIGITGLDVGVVFFVDLVFSLTEAIDLTAGFSVVVPDDAYIEANIFKGDIDDSAFEGLNSQSLPVTVVSGTATFKADLRLRVQAGAEASIDLFGIGAGAVIGIYANIIEFVAVIDKTPTCDLETEIWWDLNVGAYAHLDVVVDYTTLGPVPTVSTTLLTAPTISSCWIEAPATPALPATTSETAISTPAYSPPALSSSPAETGDTGVTLSTVVTSVPVTESTITWSSSIIPSETASGVSIKLPSTSLSDYISSHSLDTATTASPETTTSLATSSHSQGAGSSPASVSSVYYSSSVAASSYSQGVGTYPVFTPSVSYSSAAVGPTYTRTHTYVMTRCGAPGVMNCPATYQSEVVVTRTTTFCPATATASKPTPTVSSKPPGPDHGNIEVVVIVLTPLPTPVVATFVAPTEITTVFISEDHSTTTATTTSTTTITETVSHGGLQTPTLLTPPIPNVSVPGNTTLTGTGLIPGPTQSGGPSPGSQTPVIAGAWRLSALGLAYGTHVGASMAIIVAFFI